MTAPEVGEALDVAVLGAGVTGLYQLHLLRERGLRVRAYDAADDVGGAWWWHDHPGARLDTEAPEYQYLCFRRLYEDWGWSERYPGGYEVLRWLRFVADRLDLRRDVGLSTRIVAARFDPDRGRWTLRTERGAQIDARFVVAATGRLPAPTPLVGGEFGGTVLDTSRWPRRAPDLTGRRVGVVGSGASGVAAVQLVPAIVDRVAHLTVFTDGPRDVLPRDNPVYGWPERAAYRARFDELAAALPHTATGSGDVARLDGTAHTPSERRRVTAELLRDGSRRPWLGGFADLLTDDRVNADVAGVVREAMRARVADPHLAELLVPSGGPFGADRVPLERGWLEALQRDDVTVVDVRDAPPRLHPDGVVAGRTVHPLDVVVLARDVDAGAPALDRVDVRGRDGRPLAADGEDRADSVLGLAVPGFPNLFTTAGPSTPPAGSSTGTIVAQQQATWIADAIGTLLARGGTTIEARAVTASDAGAGHGSGGPGGPVGVGAHRDRCAREAAAGYPSFRLA